jgi:osmotically inducible lipoprotein OsmB
MKKQLVASFALIIVMCLTSACTTSERKDTGMVAGGVIGGVAGSALTGGSAVGTIAGAVGGGYIGRQLTN